MNNQKISAPDHLLARQSIEKLRRMDAKLEQVLDDEETHIAAVKQSMEKLRYEQVRSVLAGMDIEEINRGKQGIRVSVLRQAGIKNICQANDLPSRRLCAINGIGEVMAEKIKRTANAMAEEAARSTPVRLNAESKSAADLALLRELYPLVNGKSVWEQSRSLYRSQHDEIQQAIKEASRAKSGIRWLFSSRQKKDSADSALLQIDVFLNGEFGQQATKLIEQSKKLATPSLTAWRTDFEKQPSAYYAALDVLDEEVGRQAPTAEGLPAQLVQEIAAYPLNLQLLQATLRRYQTFGVQYILHQKNVLLGDEMGLGKTMQAIAAMASLCAEGNTHFMVVCPASVLINWCREITQHSALKAVKIHGGDTQAVEEWVQDGGVAVTTYESISRFSLPDELKVAMLIADEAHYVKNPEAIRTRRLNELMKLTGRVLFMTGTPLENRVDEMCFLVGCLQPELAEQLKDCCDLLSAPQFRQKLAPVYLRRTREEVLKELPELTEKEQWCTLTREENQAYRDAVLSSNFMEMRQVSWRIPDMTQSSKAVRLLEICRMAQEEKRKVIVFSFFRETISKVCALLGDRCLEPITGSVSSQRRQQIVDDFSKAPDGAVLVSQVQAGGTGLNIQSASVVVFCEPQLKPSIENQAIARAYRMGQIHNVLVFRLLCDNSVDERILDILRDKQNIFDKFADESVIGEEDRKQNENEWVRGVIAAEKQRLQLAEQQQNAV